MLRKPLLVVVAAVLWSLVSSRPSGAPAVLMNYGDYPNPPLTTTSPPNQLTMQPDPTPPPRPEPTPEPVQTIPRVPPQTPTPAPTPVVVPTIPRVPPTPAPTPAPVMTTTPAPTPSPEPKCPPTLPWNAVCSDRLQNPQHPIKSHTCNRYDQIHTCNIAGDPHINTFEGCPYHFMGVGYHIAAANRRFAAISLQKECGRSSSSNRWSYLCAQRPQSVSFMDPWHVSCEVEAGLMVFSDAYADRLDHCDLSYACTNSDSDFSMSNLADDVLAYKIHCSRTGCSVMRLDWLQQKTVRMPCTNTTDTNIGTASRPVWLRRTSNGVRITMDTEFGCKGTVLEYARYAFQATVDAGCVADRGLAIGGSSTGMSPLYGRTFGLCGHIDPVGRTGCGQRPGNEYSAGGRRRPMYYDRCRQMDYSEFYRNRDWTTISRTAMCGEQIDQIDSDVLQVLGQALRSSEICRYFAPGGARLSDAQDNTWMQFYALADEPGDQLTSEPIVSCDTIDMFFDALGSCNMALLDPSGMSTDELLQRDSSLQMCLFDACKARDVGVAMSNTAAFRQSMQDMSWQIEEIIAVAAAAAVAVVMVLVVLVFFWRRRLQQEHRQALLKFQKEVAANQNGHAPVQFQL